MPVLQLSHSHCYCKGQVDLTPALRMTTVSDAPSQGVRALEAVQLSFLCFAWLAASSSTVLVNRHIMVGLGFCLYYDCMGV